MHLLFPGEPSLRASLSGQGIAYAVAAKAHLALIEVLQALISLSAAADEAEHDDAIFKPWSGSVLVSLTISGRSAIAVLMNRAAVCWMLESDRRQKGSSQPQPVRAPLDPLVQALAGRKLELRIGLSPCELDLGTLESLHVGDIIPLPHALDAPLLVSTVEGVQICGAFLGCQDGFKAIELVREASNERDTSSTQPTQVHP